MCGITGIWGRDASLDEALEVMAHRGPDDAGVFRDGDLALGHRRLSIIDLSPEGAQPMTSASGRWVIRSPSRDSGLR